MLRWFKKRGQRRKIDIDTEKKDEYGFDITERRPFNYRATDHIYAEIADDVNTVDSIPRHREKRRPALPPRNNQLLRRTSYSKWKTMSLSQRTTSLPELADTITNENCADFKAYQTSGRIATGTSDLEIVPCGKLEPYTGDGGRDHNDSSIHELMIGFEKSLMSVSKNQSYVHPGSDSGYDYSCSSSNESDINDSGLSDCYEFHVSKAEQLHMLEREIHLLACHSASNDSSERRNPNTQLGCSLNTSSMSPLTHSFSMTPDLDLDDEISAYQDPKLNFRVKSNSLSQNRSTPHPEKTKLFKPPRKGSILKPLPTRQMAKPDSFHRPTREVVKPLKPVGDRGEITQFSKRHLRGNSLLGDLIRKNNNNLFFT